ncbi:hypothetical protein pb186bvf_005058 [Paramecium bursaria]
MKCYNCGDIQCLTCLKKPQLEYQYCQCNNVDMLSVALIYLYKQLYINCTYCGQPNQLNLIKKHEKACYQSEQNMIKYFESMQQFSKVRQVQNQSFQNQQIDHIFFNNINPLEYSEEDIIKSSSALLKCRLCMKKGNYYEMQYHYKSCQFEMITCECGWFVKRNLYQQHYESCLKDQMIKLQKEKEIVDYTIYNVIFHQEIVQTTSIYLDENLEKATRFQEQRDTDQDSSDSDH